MLSPQSPSILYRLMKVCKTQECFYMFIMFYFIIHKPRNCLQGFQFLILENSRSNPRVKRALDWRPGLKPCSATHQLWHGGETPQGFLVCTCLHGLSTYVPWVGSWERAYLWQHVCPWGSPRGAAEIRPGNDTWQHYRGKSHQERPKQAAGAQVRGS